MRGIKPVIQSGDRLGEHLERCALGVAAGLARSLMAGQRGNRGPALLSDRSAICREGFGHSRAQALVGSTPPPVKLGEYQRRSPAPHFLNVSQEPRRDHYRMHGDAALRCAALELFPIARPDIEERNAVLRPYVLDVELTASSSRSPP